MVLENCFLNIIELENEKAKTVKKTLNLLNFFEQTFFNKKFNPFVIANKCKIPFILSLSINRSNFEFFLFLF